MYTILQQRCTIHYIANLTPYIYLLRKVVKDCSKEVTGQKFSLSDNIYHPHAIALIKLKIVNPENSNKYNQVRLRKKRCRVAECVAECGLVVAS